MRRVNILISLGFLMASNVFAIDRFYSDQKRGWFWFEEQKHKATSNKKPPMLTPQQAEKYNEQFKQALDDARNIMMAERTVESVAKYMKLEDEMWDRAFELYHAYELAKFIHPELNNVTTNVPSVRLARLEAAKALSETIVEMAKQFDLVVFRAGNCKYCEQFEPILRDFSKQYGFAVEALSIDNSVSPYFKTKPDHNKILLKKLGIKATPTVLLVHKFEPKVLELSRGLLSFSELESRFNLAKQYFKK